MPVNEHHIMFFCCIYLPHFTFRSLKILSDIQLIRGAKKVGER